MRRFLVRCAPVKNTAVAILPVICAVAVALPAQAALRIDPPEVTLAGNYARCQLLVSHDDVSTGDPQAEDLTPAASYASSDPAVVDVTPAGRLLAVANGTANVTVTVGEDSAVVPVEVREVVANPHVGFARDVLPILSKAGCNAGACHAAQYGKGGFKLSVFGYAPQEDFAAIVRDRQGRRVNLLEPAESLVLKKPTLAVPHGGGQRLEPGSIDHQILTAYLASGAASPAEDDAEVTALEVRPAQRLGEVGLKQQLKVLAIYSNGEVRDVTSWARYDSMDEGLSSK